MHVVGVQASSGLYRNIVGGLQRIFFVRGPLGLAQVGNAVYFNTSDAALALQRTAWLVAEPATWPEPQTADVAVGHACQQVAVPEVQGSDPASRGVCRELTAALFDLREPGGLRVTVVQSVDLNPTVHVTKRQPRVVERHGIDARAGVSELKCFTLHADVMAHDNPIIGAGCKQRFPVTGRFDDDLVCVVEPLEHMDLLHSGAVVDVHLAGR